METTGIIRVRRIILGVDIKGFRISGFGVRVEDVGCKVQASGFRVSDSGFVRFRVSFG